MGTATSTTHLPIAQDGPYHSCDALDTVVCKVAWRRIPILLIAYVINFVDRVNISFAKEAMGIALKRVSIQ